MEYLTIRAVQKHPDDETLKVLIESVNFVGSVPELPTRDTFAPLEPEDFELDEADEVILEPEELQRLIDKIKKND